MLKDNHFCCVGKMHRDLTLYDRYKLIVWWCGSCGTQRWEHPQFVRIVRRKGKEK